MTRAWKLQDRLDHLWKTEASRDHLLKDGMRTLDAAEVAYLLTFRDYRSAYREPIRKGAKGWLAKDVKRYLEQGNTPMTAAQSSRARARTRASNDAPLWGPEAA